MVWKQKKQNETKQLDVQIIVLYIPVPILMTMPMMMVMLMTMMIMMVHDGGDVDDDDGYVDDDSIDRSLARSRRLDESLARPFARTWKNKQRKLPSWQ